MQESTTNTNVESNLKNNLASRLVEQTPDDDLHTVTIDDGHLATEIIFGYVEADRFRAEVEGVITHSPKFREATSVTYSPGDSQPVSFNVAHEIEVTDE
jgi:hypothetical protein